MQYYSGLGYEAEVELRPTEGENRYVLNLPGLEDTIAKAIQGGFDKAWPSMRQQIVADIPTFMEEAKPYLQEEINRTALMVGAATVGAIAVTAAIVYYLK